MYLRRSVFLDDPDAGETAATAYLEIIPGAQHTRLPRLLINFFFADSLLGLQGSVTHAKLTYIGIPKQKVRAETK